MEGIRSNVAVTTQQPKKSNKALKHALNVGLVGGGSVAMLNGARSLYCKYDIGNAVKFGGAASTKLTKVAERVHKIIAPIVDEIFPKGGKIANAIERYVGKGYLTGGADRMISQLKGKYAIYGAAAAAILALVTAGIYKAGKINGEG